MSAKQRVDEREHEQNLRDLELIRTDPAWALTAVQSWRRAEAENKRLWEALEKIADTWHHKDSMNVARADLSKDSLTPERTDG